MRSSVTLWARLNKPEKCIHTISSELVCIDEVYSILNSIHKNGFYKLGFSFSLEVTEDQWRQIFKDIEL